MSSKVEVVYEYEYSMFDIGLPRFALKVGENAIMEMSSSAFFFLLISSHLSIRDQTANTK